MVFESKIFYRDVIKMVLSLGVILLFCRLSKGYFTVVLVSLGLFWGLTGRNSRAIACFAIFPLLVIMNPVILPKSGLMGMLLRIAPLAIGLVMSVVAMGRRGYYRLPFGMLFLYLLSACLSSATGWCPKVSYMKLINFVLFLLGIWIGTQNLQTCPQDIYDLRCILFALVCVVVLGSLATIPFPNIAYSTSLAYQSGLSEAEQVAYLANLRANEGLALFAGIANHSQALAPMLAVCLTLILSDMIFLVKKVSLAHILLICVAAIELFMTRSRTGLLSSSVGIAMVVFYAVKRVRLDKSGKLAVKRIITVGSILFVVCISLVEFKSNAISRWILKTNEIEVAKKGNLIDQVTSTRQRLIDLSIDEFRRNPLLGMGFQVNFETKQLYGGRKSGLVLSAPVEKGLLATTILGEGGIIGSLAFLIFIFSYYSVCARKGLVLSIVMFTTMLATNVGEATFFSPGGVGGVIWVLCIAGGFILDMNILEKEKMERFYEMMALMRFEEENGEDISSYA